VGYFLSLFFRAKNLKEDQLRLIHFNTPRRVTAYSFFFFSFYAADIAID